MSKFWSTKMKAYFCYLDLKKSGTVAMNDVATLADRFFDEKADPAIREQARSLFADVFRKLKSSAGTDDSGVLTAEILTASLKQLRSDPKFIELYKSTLVGFFKLMDVNGDGSIQADEYARMFTTVGVRELGFVKAAFDSMDLDHDGHINQDEFIRAFVEFMTEDDEKNPYKLMYGQLV